MLSNLLNNLNYASFASDYQITVDKNDEDDNNVSFSDNNCDLFYSACFLVVNDFDIVVLGETHLTSQIDEDDLEIDIYSIKRCDHPDGKPCGGIAVYYKSDLPIILKPELTKLPESFTFHVKLGNKKMLFYMHLLKSIY